MALATPKIAPNVIERANIRAWLESYARTALRYVCAPAGSGKTTCAVLYARSRPNRVAFVTVGLEADESILIAEIARAVGILDASSYENFVDRLACLGDVEIIIDDADNATASGRQLLSRMYLDVPDSVTFIYLARTADVIAMRHTRSRGLVDVCNPAVFAFDTDEISRLIELLGAQVDASNVARLREATHGWAIAVAGACRTAAASSVCLLDALRHWRRLNDLAIRELVADALGRAAPMVAAAFRDVLDGRIAFDQRQLDDFAAAGLFVLEHDGRLALNPLVRAESFVLPGTAVDVAIAPATVEMFGRFEMVIGNIPVVWIRRRDRQIIQFLAMQPRGRATRADVISAFWPAADPHLAGQSLRSACSTIRRAIGSCVGRSYVGRYFVGGHGLELVLDHTAISTRQFGSQFEAAESAFAGDDFTGAAIHYRAAEELYRSPFLAGEPPTSWAIPYETRFASMYQSAVSRLQQIGPLRTKEPVRRSAREGGHQISA